MVSLERPYRKRVHDQISSYAQILAPGWDMAYVSLYRKYRSQTFDDVMGQDHVTKTLQNAIKMGKVAHAYLFCGTRGTGKTTTARLLAKALNCVDGPTPTPCNVCPACISITEGSAIDIMELDAASHRGIGDIKDINQNVKFPPMEMRYKVYIIDEAHQLSGDAKDAFLKTLEEPPAHAVFILATTESQSIPATIRSRCQQFDFRRGSLQDLRKRLHFVCDGEGVSAEEAALDMVAVSAEGSWRDSLSLLEQVLSYTDGGITVNDVNVVLGTVTQDFLFRLVETLIKGDERQAFDVAAEAVESGKDIQQLLKSVAQHIRNLLVAKVSSDLREMTTSEELAKKFRSQSAELDTGAMLRAMEVFTEAEKEIRFSDQHRLIFEMALLKATNALRGIQAPAPVQRQAPATPAPARPRQSEPAPPTTAQPPKEPDKPTEVSEPPVTVAESGKQDLPDFDKIADQWNQVLQHVRNIDVLAHGLLASAVPTAIRNNSLVLQFKGKGQAVLIDGDKSPKNIKRRALITALEKTFGVANIGIVCEVASAAPAPAPKKVERTPEPTAQENDSEPDPMDAVLDVFRDAKIVE